MTKRKQIIVTVPLALHTKLKWAARKEGVSMSRILRGLIEGYLAGELEPLDGKMTAPKKEHEHLDIYDQLAAKVERAVQ